MKRIIDGVRYSTGKAVVIGSYDNSCVDVQSSSDFYWFSATLYRTDSGRYFLAGEGGPMTIFAEPNGSGATFGRRLIPLTREEAREWAEKYLDVDKVEAEFGNMIEDA